MKIFKLRARLILLFSLLSVVVTARTVTDIDKMDSLLHLECSDSTFTISEESASKIIDQEPILTRQQINEIRNNRGFAEISEEFVPKGQWIFGGALSYSTHNNDKYNVLFLEDVDSYGYTLSFSPLLAYAVSTNMAVGARLVYGRTLLKVNNANVTFGDENDGGINLTVKDYYILKQSYTAMAIWRQYLPLGRNKRFALFNEMQLQMGGSQYKTAFDSPVRGTYATSYDVSLGISPGIVAFATNNVAFEVNVGIMGASYSKTKQTHNQVYEGSMSSSFLNFKINLLSIGLGVAFYL